MRVIESCGRQYEAASSETGVPLARHRVYSQGWSAEEKVAEMKNRYLIYFILLGYVWGSFLGCLVYPGSLSCKEQSYLTVGLLHNIGVDAQVVYGHRVGGAHCWVSIYGIPVNGFFLGFCDTSRYHVDFIDGYPWGYADEIA